MSELLLTYIVPVYNTEGYLDRCLSSIIAQGLPDDAYEVLVVDDGSTDGSRDRVAAFTLLHPQVHLIIQDNAGVSAARNHALDEARGRYVQFVDSDDYLEHGAMSSLLRQAVDEDLDVLQFGYKSIDAMGAVSPGSEAADASGAVMTGAEYLEEHSLTPYVWRFLVKRSYLESHHWRFDTSLIVCEDGALIAEFMLAAGRMVCTAAAPYCYVKRDDSAMHNVDVQHLKRRIFSQIDSAAMIDATIRRYEADNGRMAPASVPGLRNVYLFFAMTKALTCGCVDDAVQRMRQSGIYPFPCVGPESNYHGMKWKVIHALMMRPGLWSMMSKAYRVLKKS